MYKSLSRKLIELYEFGEYVMRGLNAEVLE